VLDNLGANKDARVKYWCRRFGVQLIYLPPYSPEFNPIEPGSAPQKQCVRKHAPRSHFDLVRVDRRAGHRITPRHCQHGPLTPDIPFNSSDRWVR